MFVRKCSEIYSKFEVVFSVCSGKFASGDSEAMVVESEFLKMRSLIVIHLVMKCLCKGL